MDLPDKILDMFRKCEEDYKRAHSKTNFYNNQYTPSYYGSYNWNTYLMDPYADNWDDFIFPC